MASPLATVGIISIGEMGLGIAKLLIAHKYRVVTNISGRSEATKARAQAANVELLSTDTALVQAADYILSIVPPRDALSTANRIVTALAQTSTPRPVPLYYLDLNAISPRSARSIAALFHDPQTAIAIDGGIIGGAPKLQTSTTPSTTVSSNAPSASSPSWSVPRIPVSGPHALSSAPRSGAHLATTLNVSHIASTIGPASGLKMCFATTTKGFTALAIQAFTTAAALGVLPELREAMAEMNPGGLKSAERGVVGMAPKAYRWVAEMQEIAATHAEEGGFEEEIFEGVARVYRSVAEDTVLGEEKTETRKRGLTVEDVASAMGEGLRAKRKKVE